MIKNQQLGLAQALAQLAQVLLQDKGLACTGIGFLLGSKTQVGGLGHSLHFASIGTGLVIGDAGLQQRLVGLLGSRATLPGDQGLGADLRRLHTVIGIGRASRRMNRLDHRGEDFHAAVELAQIGLYRPADIICQAGTVFPSRPSRVREAKSCTSTRLAVLRIKVGTSLLL